MEAKTDIDLRLGRYQDVLSDVECDVLICDPPYSEKTHKGFRTGSYIRKQSFNFLSITKKDAIELAQFWSERCRWWSIIFGDHITRQWHADAWALMDWYVFAPVRWVKTNPTPRMSGDGPTISTEEILIARRKTKLPKERIGSRPGHYLHATETGGNINTVTGKSFPGSKPINLMKAIILHYTIPGDVVCDSHAGTATTLISADQLNRIAIGSEEDEQTYNKAVRRIKAGFTPDMFVS